MKSARQGFDINYCPKCRGVWIDRGELDKLIKLSITAPALAHGPVVRSQPPIDISGFEHNSATARGSR